MIDYQLEDTVFIPFTTRAFATGIPTVLAGTPAIDIYEDATATPIITGETLVVDLNSVVGLNMITVTATAATGFNVGGHYTAVIQAGTVGSVSVVGEVVGEFTIDNSAAAKDLANGTDGLTALAADIATAQADLDIITGTAGALIDDGTGAGQIALTAGAIDNVTTVATTTTNTDMRGTDSALLAASINLTAGAVDNVTTVATTTTNTDMRGTDSALLAANINLTGGALDVVTTVTDLTVTAFAEPGQELPASTNTLAVKIGYLFKAWRNRSNQTATTYQLFNDDATTVDQKATVSDDATTAEKGEVATGP